MLFLYDFAWLGGKSGGGVLLGKLRVKAQDLS